MSKEQTSVEWLHKKLATSQLEDMQKNINLWFKQAKELEKQQMKEFASDLFVNGENTKSFLDKEFEQYYNDKYN